MAKLKDILIIICLFLIILTNILILSGGGYLAWTLQGEPLRVQHILTNVEGASKSIALAAEEQREFIKQQEVFWNDPKTQRSLGLVLRSGDDLSRIVKRFDHTLDLVNDNLLRVRDITLPNVERTTAAAGRTLQDVGATVNNFAPLGVQGAGLISDIRELKPQVMEVIPTVNSTLLSGAKTMDRLSVLEEDLHLKLPALLDSSQKFLDNGGRLAGNTADFMKQATTFAKKVNAPKSKTSRFFGFMVESVLKSAPVLIKP